jgi:putative acetyltransferase
MELRELLAASIEELTQDDYDEDQRAAWASVAEDAVAFGKRLGSMLTLVTHDDEMHLGFASLKDNKHIDMLYVHPFYAGQGVGTALCDALERLAAARGAAEISVDASETAVMFFEGRGYVASMRNTVPIAGEWLANTTMKKSLKPAGQKTTP